MAEHAAFVSVFVRNKQNTNSSTLVSKQICKFSTKLTLSDIADEVIGDRDIDKDVNFALDHGMFDTKLSTT